MSPGGSRPKRAQGQGSLVELEPGVWRLRVYAGRDPLNGKLIQPSRRFRGSRKEAEKALARFQAEIQTAGPARSGATSRTTLNQAIEAHLAASRDLAPGTLEGYRYQYAKHIAPGIGRRPVSKLTADIFREYYDRLSAEAGLSDSSIWSVYSLISGAIGRAQRERGLRFDRYQLVTPRVPRRPIKRLLTDEQLLRCFAVADELGGDWPLFLRVLCATGMRRGEAAALRWSSLDADNVLSIHAGVIDVRGQGSIEKLPKTNLQRQLLLDTTTADLWRSRQHTIAGWMDDNGLQFEPNLYVFSNDPERRRPRRADLFTKQWIKIREAAGVDEPIELRSLRNWNITVLREAGFPLEFIGARVGHEGRGSSPLAMTASYSVARRAQDVGMAGAVENRLGVLNSSLE